MGSSSHKGTRKPTGRVFKNQKNWKGGNVHRAVSSREHVWTWSSGQGRGSFKISEKQSYPSWSMASKSGGLLPKPISNVAPSPGVQPPSVSRGTTSGSSGLTEPAGVMNAIAAVEPRASVNTISVPSFITLPTPIQSTSGDTSLSDAMTQFMTAEIKARKTNKEKLKAVLAVIDSMDEDELGEVGSVPRSIQTPSRQANTSTVNHLPSPSSGSLLNFSKRPSMMNIPQCPSSSRTASTYDVLDLANSVLTSDSYDGFCNFCSKIGLSFNSNQEAEFF